MTTEWKKIEFTHYVFDFYFIWNRRKNLLTFSEVQYDQFDTLYGLDIIIVFNFIKNRYLSQPKYLLSAYQMPLC